MVSERVSDGPEEKPVQGGVVAPEVLRCQVSDRTKKVEVGGEPELVGRRRREREKQRNALCTNGERVAPRLRESAFG
jgi:hypothetical protein